ncbi:MAG: hypothetical protein C4527_04275 [Candidatus Omnitrophota bacterium]|nr:MAG: hypothetical protein C4527_04275 [Candidatus Omnitrophota bacterium]
MKEYYIPCALCKIQVSDDFFSIVRCQEQGVTAVSVSKDLEGLFDDVLMRQGEVWRCSSEFERKVLDLCVEFNLLRYIQKDPSSKESAKTEKKHIRIWIRDDQWDWWNLANSLRPLCGDCGGVEFYFQGREPLDCLSEVISLAKWFHACVRHKYFEEMNVSFIIESPFLCKEAIHPVYLSDFDIRLQYVDHSGLPNQYIGGESNPERQLMKLKALSLTGIPIPAILYISDRNEATFPERVSSLNHANRGAGVSLRPLDCGFMDRDAVKNAPHPGSFNEGCLSLLDYDALWLDRISPYSWYRFLDRMYYIPQDVSDAPERMEFHYSESDGLQKADVKRFDEWRNQSIKDSPWLRYYPYKAFAENADSSNEYPLSKYSDVVRNTFHEFMQCSTEYMNSSLIRNDVVYKIVDSGLKSRVVSEKIKCEI